MWILCGLVSGCLQTPEDTPIAGAVPAAFAQRVQKSTRPLEPLPERVPVDPARAALGERLFHDRRLSGDGNVACSNCHAFDKGGADGLKSSAAPSRGQGKVNVPTVFNVAFDFRYAWNGRFETLEEQLDFAMESKLAMAGSWEAGVQALTDDALLTRDFRAAYPQGLDAASVRDALVVFCLSLVTPNARFDRYLRGTLQLSEQELRGYDTFRDYGCISCHQGINVGGNMYQRFGVMRDYFAARGALAPVDLGRFADTKREEDRFVFRVPSLRNVALTAPYFHDGSVWTLEEAVTTMARYQLGRELPAEKVADVSAFLRSLTGELRGSAL